MEYNKLVSILKLYITRLSQKPYSEVNEMFIKNETFSETHMEGDEECYVQYWTQQQFQEQNSTWIDLFVTVNNTQIKIGGFIIFHDTGTIEVDEGVYLHSFEGLPMKVGKLC